MTEDVPATPQPPSCNFIRYRMTRRPVDNLSRVTELDAVLENRPMKIAILDDYQNVALKMADWTALAARAEITVFNDHLADVEELVERLARFDSAG